MWIYALMCSHPEPPSGWLFPFTNCPHYVGNAWSISGSISAIVCHLSTKQCYKSFTYHNENSPPPPLPACFIPLYKMFIDKAEMEMMVYPRILINLAHLSLRSGIWEAVILVPGPHPVVCGSAAILIYAVSWMQLFPVTTVAKEPWGCFRTQQELDTSLIRVYIRSLSFSCRQPAELKSECGLHFLTLFCRILVSLATSWMPSSSCFLFWLRPFHLSHPGAKRRLPWHPRFPFDWPNSLFTSPRHKRHQTDWSTSSSSRAHTDQWGLG